MADWATKSEFSIYVLRDPLQCDVIRYVGMTNRLASRYAAHVAGNGFCPAGLWCAALRSFGRAPLMDVVSVVNGTRRDAVDAESQAISIYRDQHRLLNAVDYRQELKSLGISDTMRSAYHRLIWMHHEMKRDKSGHLYSLAGAIDAIEIQCPGLAILTGFERWSTGTFMWDTIINAHKLQRIKFVA